MEKFLEILYVKEYVFDWYDKLDIMQNYKKDDIEIEYII